MTIRQIAESKTTNCIQLPRLDWLAVLKKAVSADPVEIQMIADLRKGSEAIGTEVVMCERLQVLIVCGLADRATPIPQDENP